MRAPSLQKTAAVSAALHLTVFFLSFIVLKHTGQMHLPSPYVVRLVDMRSVSQKNAGSPAKKAVAQVKESAPAKDIVKTEKKGAVVKEPLVPAEKKAAIEKETSLPAEKSPQRKSKPDKIDEQLIEDSIGALKAKRKIEKIVSLRNMISVGKASGQNNAKIPSDAFDGTAGTVGEASYIDKVSEEIWSKWDLPDYMVEKNLEAIIAVKIGRDGTLKVQKVEKSSGNRLFDRAALQTIAKASPVSLPPYEMEIGIRFYP